MTNSEARLVERAQAGDQEAFAMLYRRHIRLVYSLARHLLDDDDFAMDVTQEVFVKAWQALPRLRIKAAFGGWLRMIATNVIRDHGRRRKPQVALEDEAIFCELPDLTTSVADGFINAESRAAVREAVARLPEPQRLVIIMHHFENRPVADIAAELQVPLGTVLSRLARGREALKRRLTPYFGTLR